MEAISWQDKSLTGLYCWSLPRAHWANLILLSTALCCSRMSLRLFSLQNATSSVQTDLRPGWYHSLSICSPTNLRTLVLSPLGLEPWPGRLKASPMLCFYDDILNAVRLRVAVAQLGSILWDLLQINEGDCEVLVPVAPPSSAQGGLHPVPQHPLSKESWLAAVFSVSATQDPGWGC